MCCHFYLVNSINFNEFMGLLLGLLLGVSVCVACEESHTMWNEMVQTKTCFIIDMMDYKMDFARLL